MTPQKFLLKKLDTDLEGLEQYVYDYASTCDLTDKIEDWMLEFAKIMCEKQKEICAEEAEVSGGLDEGFRVDPDSILSSPLPKEL